MDVQVVKSPTPDIPISTPEDSILAPNIPPWLREIAASRVNRTRTSRASSIISTRTRFSTTTHHDDARSIDIHVGGHHFRISRDGSHVTDAPPPPYAGPSPGYYLDATDASSLAAVSEYAATLNDGAEVEDAGNTTPTFQPSTPRSMAGVRHNILNPLEIELPSPIVDNESTTLSSRPSVAQNTALPERTPSYKPGPEVISVVPNFPRTRTASQNDVPLIRGGGASTFNLPLRRRNGVRLPSLITDEQTLSKRQTIDMADQSHTSPLQTRSAGPILSMYEAEQSGLSPTFIGRNTVGLFQTSGSCRPVHTDRILTDSTTDRFRQTSTPLDGVLVEGHEDDAFPPAMDNANDISLHYARLMRRLDRDHRRELHAKDREMAVYRERLNEIDTVYRQELKARDFIIDDLKKRLDFLDNNIEDMVEKARFQIEDIWEKRWKDQEHHLRERMKRLEEEAEAFIEQSTGRKVAFGRLVSP